MPTWSSFYSVIDVLSTTLSLPLAIIGFGVAYFQIRKTRAAAESARDAALAARSDASRAAILILLPQLQRVEEQIDRAVETRSVELVLSWSNAWRWQASQLSGHIDVVASSRPQLPQLLQASVMAASTAKTALVGSSTPPDIARATKRMRDAIMAVTSELGALTVHYSSPVEGSTP